MSAGRLQLVRLSAKFMSYRCSSFFFSTLTQNPPGPLTDEASVVEDRTFGTMAGRTWWGPNPCYRVEDPVCAERKIVHEGSSITWNQFSGVRFSAHPCIS